MRLINNFDLSELTDSDRSWMKYGVKFNLVIRYSKWKFKNKYLCMDFKEYWRKIK